MTKPNPKNWCGGNYRDWMEVMLTEKCNGKCLWCIEKEGFKPEKHAYVEELSQLIINSKASNIILLGGEPTLYKDLPQLVKNCSPHKNIYITTNGSRLTTSFIRQIRGISGLNISIHHYNLLKNAEITGINLHQNILFQSIELCQDYNIKVRLNCNLIKGYIDTEEEIYKYARWSKSLSVNSIRFAELKVDEDNFVDVAKILQYKYGLSDDPFVNGCNKDAIINDMPVNFRQMCGFQTSCRKLPDNPIFNFPAKNVLYYDGLIYKGWQKMRQNAQNANDDSDFRQTIRQIIKEEITQMIKEEVKQYLSSSVSSNRSTIKNDSSPDCQY